MDLLRQSGESLAGRIEHVEMTGLTIREAGSQSNDLLWLRGGLPDSFLAASDSDSLAFRSSFLRTYFERDIPQLGWKIPVDTLSRLWIMLAHSQGQILNASTLARSLEVSVTTINRYLGLLVDLLLVRRLAPYSANIKKRLVKSPKFYIRDSGLVHALLGIETADQLEANPVVGSSWEGHVIENILNSAPAGAWASFYRTADGAEIDLVLELPGNCGVWAIEVKRSLAVKLSKGFHSARSTLKPARTFIVHASDDEYPLPEGIEVVGLEGMCKRLECN